MKEPTENHHPALQLYFLATLASFAGKVRSQPGFQQQVALKKTTCRDTVRVRAGGAAKDGYFPSCDGGKGQKRL